MTNYKFQGYLAKQDNLRKEALSSQDGLKYYNLCNDLGMEPEDKYLFEQGQAEQIFQANKLEAMVNEQIL